MNRVDNAMLALATSIVGALATLVTGDTVVSAASIGAGVLRLTLAHRRTRGTLPLYRAPLASQRTRLASVAHRMVYRPCPSGSGYIHRLTFL